MSTSGRGETVRESLTVADCTGLDESVTWNVRLVVLLTDGVPEMTPVFEARLMPAGSAPETTDHA